MKKNNLNVFEILTKDDTKAEAPAQKKEQNVHTDDQESESPDRLFREAIEKAISEKGETGRELTVEHEEKQSWRKFIIEIGVIFLTVLLIFNFVISVSRISGNSMQPNFCEGDRVVTFRLTRNFKPGDVIVFKTKSGDKLIKRVIAVEGDTVDISKSKGGLYINGKAAEENYVYTPTAITDQSVEYPITVGKDSLFVLGDNRINSKDSRMKEVGLVKKADVVGRVVLDVRGI